MNLNWKSQKALFAIGITLLCLTALTRSVFHVAPASESWEFEREEEDELRPDQPDEALKFRRLQLQDEKGVIPPDGLQKARLHVEAMRRAQRQQLQQGIQPKTAGIRADSWSWLGPGNIGGRIRSIVIHPTNALRMWAGSVGGGIWRSNDGGLNWQPVNDFIANLAVSSLVINRANPNIMYAGTGEGFTNVDALQGFGVFKSSDGGVTWNLLASTNPTVAPVIGCGVGATPCPPFWFYVNRLAISPNGNTILAATWGGIAQSTDGGTNWTQRNGTGALDIDFHPTDSNRAIVGELAVARLTTDGGQTWQFVDGNGITQTQATFTPAINNGGTAVNNGRVELTYARSNPTVIFAAVNNNNGDVYRSTNGGQTYTRVNTGNNFFLGANNQGWYDNTIWVSPVRLNGVAGENFVIVGGIDLWRSTDCGTINPGTGQVQCNFTPISRWQCGPGQEPPCAGPSAHADQHVIVEPFNFADTDLFREVYFGNDGGIYRVIDIPSVTTTSGWTALNNNFGVTQFYGAAANFNGVIIGGAQDNGILRFSGDPQAWTIGSPGDGGYCAADPTNPNFLYSEKTNLAIFRSTNAGVTFSSIPAGISDAGNSANSNFIAPLVIDPGDPNTLLAGGINLWRTNNARATASPTPTWTNIKAAVAPRPPAPGATPNPTPPISAIAVSPGNSDLIVVGHNDGQLYRTFGGTGASPIWTRIDNGTPQRFVSRLVIDDSHFPNWIYATYGGFNADNVYRSTDSGATWTDITGVGTGG